jgi:hypothetical protein
MACCYAFGIMRVKSRYAPGTQLDAGGIGVMKYVVDDGLEVVNLVELGRA